jgi:mono/diheme cytochrome c family protein
MNLGRFAWVGLLAAGAICPAASRRVAAQETADYFRQNCTSCHTIGGGRLTGPDLKDVEGRKDSDWLVRFILDPQAMLDSGDPYVTKLKEESRGNVMTKAVGITKDRAEALLKLIAAESKLERSQFAGMTIPTEPFTPEEIQLGEDYFTGVRRFENAAAACYSCHAVRGTGALGGGRLGPDLTLAFERLEGRKNLWAWLTAPATSTMQPLFKKRPLTEEEIRVLVAFLEESTAKGGEENMSGPLAFLLLGLGGAVLGMVLFDTVWKKRFRAVRSLLVRLPSRQGDNES